MSSYTEIFQPFVDLFTQSQVNTILLAWLPSKFGSYMTGIMAVDMFITSIIASGVSTFALALYTFASTYTFGSWKKDNSVTVQVEYYTEGIYGDLVTSIFYESLSWLISQQTKKLDKGSFVVQHANSVDGVSSDDDECAPPNFNILPEKEQQIDIEYKGKKFEVTFNMPEQEKNEDNKNTSSSRNKPKPSIFITVSEDSNASVDYMTDFLNEVTRAYLETQKKMKVRSRYERNGSYWYHVQSLSSIRGLDTVALDKPQEILLKKELETFVNDKDFYGRIGMPYRRGILLFGKPGTGKTSLINAISSQLSRDIYYLNLKNITDDNGLSAAFSSVPANQIIVLEDVDTQSKILHKRTRKESLFSSFMESSPSSSSPDKKDEIGPSSGGIGSFSKFSLSTFLGCLDGHILSEGNIIIMTTNHVEHLDPACIRPGRMDVHLDLGYCSHYQIKKMYRSVVEDPNAEFPKEYLDQIPEKLLPPCEVMMTMVLYRNEIELIPGKILEIVAKYKDMKPEEIAKQMEEEARRLERMEEEARLLEKAAQEKKEEEAKSEKKDEKKDEVSENKDEKKDEVSEKKAEVNENKDEKKEEIKNENEKKEEVKNEIEKKEEVKNENEKKEEVKNENEKKEEIKNENEKKEEVKNENEKKEEVKDENKDENKKETNKEEKKEEEIIKKDIVKKEETIETDTSNNTGGTTYDSDSSTDVEVENDKIKKFKTVETSTITSQVSVIS